MPTVAFSCFSKELSAFPGQTQVKTGSLCAENSGLCREHARKTVRADNDAGSFSRILRDRVSKAWGMIW